MFKTLAKCNNTEDFRLLAKSRLPAPIFHYIDGAADDEITIKQNTRSYECCDLVPNVLAGVQDVDISVELMGKKIDMPIFCSPTALQRLFHHDGELAVGKAAQKFNTFFGVSSLGTYSLKKLQNTFQLQKYSNFIFIKIVVSIIVW